MLVNVALIVPWAWHLTLCSLLHETKNLQNPLHSPCTPLLCFSSTKAHLFFSVLTLIHFVKRIFKSACVCLFFCLLANCTEDRHGAGVLTAPGSPGPYFENADCVVNLSVDEGNQLELKFTGVFDVESKDGKCIDFIQVGATLPISAMTS